MTIKPLGNNVVGKVVKVNAKSKSGIILSTENKSEQALLEVIAIGPGIGDDEDNVQKLGIKVGDIVVVSSYAGQELKDADQPDIEYKIVNAKDIKAVVVMESK